MYFLTMPESIDYTTVQHYSSVCDGYFIFLAVTLFFCICLEYGNKSGFLL